MSKLTLNSRTTYEAACRSFSVLLSASLLLLAGCSPPEPIRPDLPNIILISADTLRADRLSTYGYEQATSPWLDSFAQRSLLFEEAYSQANVTNPSHASMFTSLHVSTHGILDNRGYRLSPQATTLAEVLREAGYETAGFTSVHHMHFELNGLGQGFDHHWGSKGISSAEEVNQQVFKWLDRRDSDRPFFLFVHYFDTHTPYSPPPEFLEPFYQGDPRDPSNTSLREVQLQPDQVESFATWLDGITDIEYVKALYDGAILYLDSQLRELEYRLRRDILLDNSIVVFTADHGESLVEHGIYFGHLGLYEPSIQIPLLIQSPMQSSRVVQGTAQSVDIAPTVLGLAGLGIPVEMEGRDLTQWTASGEHLPEDQTIYSEHAHAGAVSMKQGGWKYIYPINPYNQLSKVEELFNLREDPGELVNLALDRSAIADSMREQLRQWLEQKKASSLDPIATKPSKELLEKLRALGYVK